MPDGVEPGPTHRVVFTPSGRAGTVADGTPVLQAARQLGADLSSLCGGGGVCGRCAVRPQFGRFPTWSVTSEPDHLSPWGAKEETYRSWRALPDDQRLGCAARVLGDVVIDVPPSSQVHRQVIRKDTVDLGDLVVDPLIELRWLELAPAADDDGTAATRRITAELARAWGVEDAVVDPALLGSVHAIASAGPVTVALRGDRIVGLWPGRVERVAGIAVDLGSTTVAGHLCDLSSGEILATAGRMNPQIRYGEDLMSRVSYAMLNEGGAAQLTAAARAAAAGLVDELVGSAAGGLDPSQVLELVVVGNPVMHHLLLGIDPAPLGQAPFVPATADPVEGSPAALIGLGDLPGARLWVGPLIAGHVGADTAAAILAEGPHRGDGIMLVVDVGTNAEIVLGNRDQLYAASSPTGPAFEGAQLTAGQRATAGAIERVRIDPATLEPRFKVIGVEPWSDEPGFEAAAARTGITGICGSGIIEVLAELHGAGVIDGDGVLGPVAGVDSPRIAADGRTFAYTLAEGVAIDQNDVRAVQLAKAALRAGTELLLERAGLTAGDIGQVCLAGAFGAHISAGHAIALGLIPPVPVERVRSVGNAAGAGALRALLSASQRAEMTAVAAGVQRVETATEPRFQEHFVAALAIPHASAVAARPRRRRTGRASRVEQRG